MKRKLVKRVSVITAMCLLLCACGKNPGPAETAATTAGKPAGSQTETAA